MATVNFRLRSKANKNVSIKVYHRANVIELNTGFTINWKDSSKDIDRFETKQYRKQTNFNQKIRPSFTTTSTKI
jgi:hypothetical protein